jgi:hypothetical protein
MGLTTGDGRLREDAPARAPRGPRSAGRRPAGAGSGAVLGVLCLGLLLSMYNATVVNVMLPDIRVSLHASGTGLAWVAALYSLVYAALLMGGGALGRGPGGGRRSWAGSRCSRPGRPPARPPRIWGSWSGRGRCRRPGSRR